MSSFPQVVPPAALAKPRLLTPARLLHGLLAVLAGLAALAFALHLASAFWAENEFSQPEGIVANQSRMMAETGRLYYSLRDYPYTVCAYMPTVYTLQAGLRAAGMTGLLPGRLISFAALLFLVFTVYQMLLLYSCDRRCARLGAALCGCASGLPVWGTVGQVDMLALAFAVGAFHQFSRFWVSGAPALPWAAALAVAALFTKQTYIAAPAAISIALWFRYRREAYRFALTTGGAALALVAFTQWLTGGNFLNNTIFANLNPFSWEKVEQHASLWLITSAQLALITVIGRQRLLMSPARPILLYTALATGVLLITAPKVGSDSNYQMEMNVALILTACLALHALSFFDLVFTKTQSWIPLLIMPLLVHAVLNYRLEFANLIGRVAKEQEFRGQMAGVRTKLAGQRRVLSSDTNLSFQLGQRIEVEPLIYRMLVEAGRIPPARLTADLQQQAFSAVVLYQDLRTNEELHEEIPALTRAQHDVIRARYRHTAFVPGPYRGGVHIYEPSAVSQGKEAGDVAR